MPSRVTHEKPVAFVTGGAIRLGRAMAEALAADGYDLVLHGNRSARELEALARVLRSRGTRVKVLRGDLSKALRVTRLAREAWKAYGRVDVLVNNAALFAPTPLPRLDAAEFDRYVNVNLKAPYLLAAQLGRKMRSRGSGQIVNFACLSAFKAWRDYVPYSISKAGVVALTQGLAKLLAPEIRVNAIAPGTVLPPEDYSGAALRALKRRIPLSRLGQPGDIVRALRYLLNAEFVTGQVLVVDGGRSLR
ncbi:MAG: SDR family oxidoreductase [Planctomycetes bacterium]|nr:SDR family oxidoreductase [Planctomycetota bacterium]